MGFRVGTGEGHAAFNTSTLWAIPSMFGVLDGHGEGVDAVI
jgi:hypothetical protein